jgi:CheY-like chemotaxis protein
VGEQLKMVDRNADQLSSLLDNLLDLTRFESGVLELEFRLMDLNQVLRQTIRTLQPSVQPRNIRFELELDEEAVMVQGDQQRLGHVFEHVLGLLARFAAPVSVIYIRSWVEAERVHVSFVSKTSRLPENASKEVFEIFYQINDAVTGKVLDSTVGLAFAKQVLEKHNGGIVLETPADSERRIVLDLPRGLADQKSAESDALEMPDDSEISIVAEGKRTLLVVDDNDQIRKFIRLIFAKQYEIREAENGLEALENIQSTPPDLVIADVMMPVLDGVSMVKRMRTDPMMAGIPVIMVTAKDTVEDTVEGLEAGADVYLTKPFHADVLKTQVAALIKTRELLRAKVSAGQSTPVAVPSDPLLKKLYALFEEHFSNPDFGVEDIADKLFMERTQLFRKLKAAGGEGPRNLLVRYRLEKARTMISERAGTITEIAYACGFNSLSHFGQMFKAEYGVTPREWLEQQKTSS